MAHKYTDEQRVFIRQNIKGTYVADLTKQFNHKFGTDLSYGQVKAFVSNNKLTNGMDSRFKPGTVPPNKGKKGGCGGVETQFKKGQMPYNHAPVGTEVIRGDGYLWRKIKEPKTWKQVHRMIWEEAHGKIPQGHKLLFVDGDRMNITLDNLVLLTNAEALIMNKNSLIKIDPELTKVGVNIAKVIDKINKRKR